MKILHPDHKIAKPLSQLTEYLDEGVYSIIAKEEKEKLNYFLKCFEAYRKDAPELITDISLYKGLPFSIQTPLWKARQKDVKIIEKLIAGRKNLKILDIGAWNGWLCNYFAKQGHEMVGIGVFINEYDGLKAFKHYDSEYISLQLALENIFRIKDQFDIIIFNRNWSYVYNKKKVLLDAINLLPLGGIMFFTGLVFHSSNSTIADEISNSAKIFEISYKIPLFLRPVKGYLKQKDYLFLQKNKIDLRSYKPFKNSINSIFKKKPSIKYGIFIK